MHWSSFFLSLTPALLLTWITPSPVYTALLANGFPNKLELNLLYNKKSTFFSFVSFLIISLAPFISKADSSRDLIFFVIYFISLLEIFNATVPKLKLYFGILASAADVINVNANGVKKLLANGVLNIFH